MRIIAGKFKGHRLQGVNDLSTRPATDLVKGSIFNCLQNRLSLDGANVLDIFAGTGSLGFEAISRGAARVVFIDNNKKAIKAIKENAFSLRCKEQCEIYCIDAFKYIQNNNEQFDLVFADPPYHYEYLEELPMAIFRHHCVCEGGYLIIEHPQRIKYCKTEYYIPSIHKRFGNTCLTFFIHPQMEKD